jgi:hypothetical protein
MAKKGKKVAAPKQSLREQKVAEDLTAVQKVWGRVVTLAVDKREDREWVLVPIAIPKVDSREFITAIAGARVELRGYTEWDEVHTAARELSQIGGVERVFILSNKKTSRVDVTAEFVDGIAAHKVK